MINMDVKVIKQKNLKYKGKTLLLSWVEVFDEYEIVVLEKNGHDRERVNVSDYKDAEFYYKKFLNKYSENKQDKPIPKRYIKFAKDYNYVYNSCKEYFLENPIEDDFGASVLDCCGVYIGERVSKTFLESALKPYKLNAFIDKGRVFVRNPYTQYQGHGCTLQAKYMMAKFKELGYESWVHYQID